MSFEDFAIAPAPGHWPVPPQDDAPVSKDRIWVDGCFDFSHHGHAGAMLQARRLGDELYVGIHSDEAILENKGPTVMTLNERVSAVEACRWSTASVPHAPYVTSLPWISHYGCYYVVHGDDITSDSNGEDCYRFVKAAGRFLVVKRTPGISTTDLVGRMLLCTRGHFIHSLAQALAGQEGHGTEEERKTLGAEMKQRIADYASDETGKRPGADVWIWSLPGTAKSDPTTDDPGRFDKLVAGDSPRPGQRVVYVDGGFDLFSSGHIEFLKKVVDAEEAVARAQGWYETTAASKRRDQTGSDYSPVYVIAGVHDDEVINRCKGVNYPIMNIFERGLCVLQCRYIQAVVFSAPFTPCIAYLRQLPHGAPQGVYHGPTSFMGLTYDPYRGAKELGIYREIGAHEFADVNAETIVQRILKSRAQYEERQRVKGVKGAGEEAVRKREEMERAAALEKKEREREAGRGAQN
ncbi:MAG: hypothetical protein M1838_006027 [Thelocarpon superellum]|nr:MAG: hypothetical protein M1838_006027 [Thelocarpon superellum]